MNLKKKRILLARYLSRNESYRHHKKSSRKT